MNFPIANAQVWRNWMRRAHGIFTAGSGGSLWMYASSAGEIFGCSVGLRYSGIQNATQASPASPVMMNADSQPKFSARIGTTAGAMIAPTFDPALKIPV